MTGPSLASGAFKASGGGNLALVATTGQYDDLLGKPTLGTAAAQDVGYFATAAQGLLASTALQPGAQIPWGDVTGKPAFGTAALQDTSAFAAAVHTHTASQISDASANGRSLITAADYAAMRTLLTLNNVNNTSDANKPISTATQTALDLKAPIASPTFTGAVTLPGDPASALQAATKQYVDGLLLNMGKRGRVRVATTANITISTALNSGDVIDGVTLANGDLVLVKDQTTGSQNGIYVVSASPARSTEFDTWDEFPGALVGVAEGTANDNTLWFCTNNSGGTLGTTAITFTQFRISGELLAANNLSDIANAATAFGNIKQAATTSATGVVELATDPEMTAGTSTTVVPVVKQVADYVAANAGGAFTLLQSVDVLVAVAAVDFTTGINSTYDEYEIHIQNAVPSTAAAFQARTSTNGGSSFDSGASDYNYAGFYNNTGSSTVTATQTAGAAQLLLTGPGVPASSPGISGVVRLIAPSAVQNGQVLWSLGGANSGGSISVHGCGQRLAAADIDAIRFFFASGNIASGKFKLYGVKK